MSSSLEYLVANFDEEPAPRPSSMVAFSPSHHCYGNSVGIGHPWIASRASSTAAASSVSATTTRETMAMAMAMEPPRPWNSHPLLPPPHHRGSPRASTGGGTLHSPDTTQRHRHPPRDSPAAVPRGLHIHGGFDYLFGYPAVPAHGAAARTSLEEAIDVMSSSFGYQPQSQRGRTLFPAEGCPVLEAERGAASMAGGSIGSDDDLGEVDGDSIATIDFTSSDDESAGEENDDDVVEEEEGADVEGEEAPRNEESTTTSPTTSPTVESAGRQTARSASEAADELRQWLWYRSNNREEGRSHDATTSGNQMPSAAASASRPTESTAAAPVAPPSDPQIPTPPSRARRQAAISCLERISTAIATSGMGGYHSSDDDDEKEEEEEQDEEGNMSSAPDDVEDRKPTATNESITNRIRKRNHPCKTLGGKKRKCEEQEPPNEQPEESEAPSPCCICLEIPTAKDLASISGCSHPFCFGCIEKWAERENTCPLCKARFLNIERVNFCGTNNSEKSKKVTNRDQRTDFSFMNSLTGIGMFANLETHGTWPTHIAQLLFSGLGASTIHEGFGEAARTGAQTRRVERVRTREREATGRNPHPPRVGFSSRRPSNVTASMGNRRAPAGGTSHREPFSDFLDRVNAHRQQQEQIQRIRANVEQVSAFASAAAAAGGGASSTSSSYRHTFAPFSHATTTRRTTTTTTTESTSPWSSSRSSFHVHVGPHSSSQMPGSSTASPLAFSPFGSPSPTTSPARSGAPSAAAAASSIAHASILGNPFASINIRRREEEEEEEEILSTLAPESYVQRLRSELERANEQRDEEEEILSTISPSTYIQRLRRELERTSEQFQFSASASTTTTAGPGWRTGVTSFNPEGLRRSAFHYSSVRPMRNNRGLGGIGGSTYDNQAGRSAETALEIDDSDSDDDDVVEVVAVEAMM